MRGLKRCLHGTAVLGVTLAMIGFASGQTWSQDGPVSRYHTSAVYDVVTDQMIVFGGMQNGTAGPLNDVWGELQVAADGESAHVSTNWVPVYPTGTAPAARFGHTAIYDSSSNNMVLFAGATSSTACLQDLWILDDANSADGTPAWLNMTASGTAPAARTNHIAAYDPGSNTMIVFSGTNCSSGYFSDVWTLSNANGEGGTPTWTQLLPSGSQPAARENSSAIYDSVNNILTIYGGDSGGNGFSDVWTLSNANGHGGTPQWTQLSPTGTAPHARTGQSSVYDSVDNRMIIFGGSDSLTSTSYLSDTWILTNANGLGGAPAWKQLAVTGRTPQEGFHCAFYSSAYNTMIVFAGESFITEEPADDHIFVLSKANGLD